MLNRNRFILNYGGGPQKLRCEYFPSLLFQSANEPLLSGKGVGL